MAHRLGDATSRNKEVQMEIGPTIKYDEIARLLTGIPADDRVDPLKYIPKERV